MATAVGAHQLPIDHNIKDLPGQRGEVASDEGNRTLAASLTERIEIADVVVGYKIDKVHAVRRDDVTVTAEVLNQTAQMVYAKVGGVPLKTIPDIGRLDLERVSSQVRATNPSGGTHPKPRPTASEA